MAELLYDPRTPEVHANPYPIYRRLRAEAPVYHMREKDFWVLSRFEDIYDAARAPELTRPMVG